MTIATGENFYGETALSVKVTDLAEFPTKGRATAGVRAHRFLKGETELVTAFAGPEPQGAATGGGARKLPVELGRRDGSGQPLESKVDAIGTIPHAYGAQAGSAAPEAAAGEETTSGGLSAEELARRKEEIAQARDEDDSPVIIVSSDDEDEGSGGALF